ncbi:hypothetical protein BXZ70DRAFT_600191 [Cristinia sonorae]|uniref:T6SS Phospholipase effector Tle1-like catalytic domain-containing protein n=1 Tax=Cristinia sonorae TaxID=1940300 RepID=A0A8K0UWK9_9AGAR|nr:hypothetical protein BXZ70DRAFT_600191 [Cristinia sonorae]
MPQSSVDSSTTPTSHLPTIVTPPKSMTSDKLKRRTLVLCFDGTANQFDGDNTNVVKFYSLLKKDEAPEQQICYYQPGIGTYIQPGVVSPLFSWCAKIMDQAVAWYMDAHVRGGYTFLMQNYRTGDKICIFGFSRGAYTARALAGMLHKIGLLPKDNPEQVPFAYKLYTKTDQESLKIAAGYKQTFCRSVEIEFVGVWDTVASVGVLLTRNLPFTTANTTIKTFRHALSLDEHRVKFRPNLYHRPAPDADAAKLDPNQASNVLPKEHMVEKVTHAIEEGVGKIVRRVSGGHRRSKSENDKQNGDIVKAKTVNTGLSSIVVAEASEIPAEDISIKDSAIDVVAAKSLLPTVEPTAKPTDVLEVWFAGCHCDVGGGSVLDTTEYSLSDITLRWMVRQVVLSQVGITFDEDALKRARIPNSVFTGAGFPVTPPASGAKDSHGIQTTLKGKLVEPIGADDDPFSSPKTHKKNLSLEVPGTSAEDGDESGETVSQHSAFTELDSVQPMHDELKLKKAWWLLECMPLTYAYQDGKGRWHKRIGAHWGKGRRIPDIKPNFHKSVQQRMNDKNLKYAPRAVWKKGTENYVD